MPYFNALSIHRITYRCRFYLVAYFHHKIKFDLIEFSFLSSFLRASLAASWISINFLLRVSYRNFLIIKRDGRWDWTRAIDSRVKNTSNKPRPCHRPDFCYSASYCNWTPCLFRSFFIFVSVFTRKTFNLFETIQNKCTKNLFHFKYVLRTVFYLLYFKIELIKCNEILYWIYFHQKFNYFMLEC